MEARYIVDENGERVSVIPPIDEYERMIGEMKDIQANDEAKAEIKRGEEPVSWDKVREGASLPTRRNAYKTL